MKSFTTALAPLILLGLLTGPAGAKDPPLLSLNMAHFKDTATVTEDSKNATTTISTENGFAEHKGPMRMVWNDEFLEAVIDGETGRRSFQVHAWVIYNGAWRDYEAASYQTANGLRSVPAAAIRRTSENCLVRECTYTEHVAFAARRNFCVSSRRDTCRTNHPCGASASSPKPAPPTPASCRTRRLPGFSPRWMDVPARMPPAHR